VKFLTITFFNIFFFIYTLSKALEKSNKLKTKEIIKVLAAKH